MRIHVYKHESMYICLQVNIAVLKFSNMSIGWNACLCVEIVHLCICLDIFGFICLCFSICIRWNVCIYI